MLLLSKRNEQSAGPKSKDVHDGIDITFSHEFSLPLLRKYETM